MAEGAIDVVVGAGSGMGLAVAEALAGDRPLLLADFDVAAVEALARRLPHATAAGMRRDRPRRRPPGSPSRCPTLGRWSSPQVCRRRWHPAAGSSRSTTVGTARLLAAFEPAVGPGSVAVCFASLAAHAVPPLPDELLAVLDDPLGPDYVDRLLAAGLPVDDPGAPTPCRSTPCSEPVRARSGAWGRQGRADPLRVAGIIDTPMGRQEYARQPAMPGMVSGSPLGRQGTAGRSRPSWRSSARTQRPS
jgi:hypothetical protein